MRFREIKEAAVIVLNNGMVAQVAAKRIEAEINVIDIVDSDGVIHTVTPKDVKQNADADVAANFYDLKNSAKTDAVTASDATVLQNLSKPNNVRVIRYVRPKDASGAIGNKGVTLVFDIDHAKNELTIYHAECNGETFCKTRGVEEALKKTPEVFPFNRNHSLVGHVVYIVTKAKRRNMKHLAQLRVQILEAAKTRRLG